MENNRVRKKIKGDRTMSSFIVSQECMNRIINGLYWTHDFKDINIAWYMQYNLENSKDFELFGNRLFRLNANAVSQCYGSTVRAPKYKWTDDTISIFQFLKSVQCLIYQCAEGDVIDTSLYRDLVLLEKKLMHHIIYHMPEYKEAEWG
jgi:GH43 family beta-xylosidase